MNFKANKKQLKLKKRAETATIKTYKARGISEQEATIIFEKIWKEWNNSRVQQNTKMDLFEYCLQEIGEKNFAKQRNISTNSGYARIINSGIPGLGKRR